MSLFTNNALIGASGRQAGAGSYQISRSLRFNSADSAYLSRTPSVAGNRKTWTWAGWVKQSALNSINTLLGCYTDASNRFVLAFDSTGNNTLIVQELVAGVASNFRVTTSIYRDLSAWMHVALAIDTTQATAANRIKLYVNGAQVTAFSTSNDPTQDQNLQANRNSLTYIGRHNSGTIYYSNCYLADIHFIDGQALTPSSFGAFDSNGVWQPKAYSGSYGTNGFHLDFSDNSAATAAALGKDSSGNANNWTPNNLSVTTGSGNDSLVDSPTNYGTDTGVGGEVRGNYCTLNPLLTDTVTKSNGNLDFTTPAAPLTSSRATFGITSGKWYWEIVGTVNGQSGVYGIVKETALLNTYVGGDSSGWGYDGTTGQKFNNTTAAYGATYTTNDVIGVAFDADAGTLAFYKNGVTQGTAYTGLTSGPYFPAISDSTAAGTTSGSINFGQRPFAYTAPSGYKALCTQNLPTPTILNGATAMDVKLYSGNGSTQTITGLGFSPDLVWVKGRSQPHSHRLVDTVRGATKSLFSNATDAETTEASALTAFNSDGFALGSTIGVNESTTTYAAWCWDAGNTTVTNTAGTITSQVRANASAGFSVVTYTGTGVNATVGHGLGVAPALLIVKRRSSVASWAVYHVSIGAGNYLSLNITDPSTAGSTLWNSTGTTSSVFSLGSSSLVNGNTSTHVAYCFAPVSGYSAFGSYTGNLSADGPFVYTGFRPRWILIKQTTAASTTDWVILDSSRLGYNEDNDVQFPNQAAVDNTGTYADLLSNGFKPRSASGFVNTSSGTYIYAAFAENPFSISRAR